MLTSPRWTNEANTLFLVKVLEHGRFLYEVEPAALTTNHAVSHAQGLLYIAQLFPEFCRRRDVGALRARPAVPQHGRAALRRRQPRRAEPELRGHHHRRGSWRPKLLDERNGDAWPRRRSAKLTAAIDAFHEILSPDGATPAIGDSYRRSSVTLWLKANLVQGETKWPAAKPRTRDAWLFGPDAVRPFEDNPVSPALGDAPRAYALPRLGQLHHALRAPTGTRGRSSSTPEPRAAGTGTTTCSASSCSATAAR